MTEPPRPPDEPAGPPPPDPTAPRPPEPPASSYPAPGQSVPPPGYSTPPPGEATPPPGGYAPPPGGYAPGFPAAPPPGYADNDEKTFALVAHFGGALGAFISLGVLGFVGPLIAYLAKGQQSQTVRAHATAALNFQLLWSIVAFALLFVSWCLLFIPSIIVMAIQVAFGIIAGVKANEGELYRYPTAPTFIK